MTESTQILQYVSTHFSEFSPLVIAALAWMLSRLPER